MEPMPLPLPLPLLLPPYPDESGMGACLRVASANGVNLHWLRREVRMPDRSPFYAKYAERLAGILQLDPDWLRPNLEDTSLCDVNGWKGLLQAHQFSSRNHLRRTRPQICASCVHLFGYCRASWEYSLVTACECHRTPLLDACGRCGEPLRWDRPRIDQCSCGWPLGASQSRCDDSELAIARLVVARLDGRPCRTVIQSLGLPLFLSEMSLDGVFSILHAFGDLKEPTSKTYSCVATKGMAVEYWRRVAIRAAERLRWLAGGTPPCDLAINVPLLARLMRRGVTPGDRAIAVSLMQSMTSATTGVISASELVMQGELFEWKH